MEQVQNGDIPALIQQLRQKLAMTHLALSEIQTPVSTEGYDEFVPVLMQNRYFAHYFGDDSDKSVDDYIQA